MVGSDGEVVRVRGEGGSGCEEGCKGRSCGEEKVDREERTVDQQEEEEVGDPETKEKEGRREGK